MTAPTELEAQPGTWLSTEESRRATCLAVALEICRGRSVQIETIWKIARWLYNGELS